MTSRYSRSLRRIAPVGRYTCGARTEYSDAFASYGTEPNDFVREVADRIPEGPVLCLAEGEGRDAVFLAERGHAVTAVDLSEVGMANAKKLAAERNVPLATIVADLADFDPGTEKWRVS